MHIDTILQNQQLGIPLSRHDEQMLKAKRKEPKRYVPSILEVAVKNGLSLKCCPDGYIAPCPIRFNAKPHMFFIGPYRYSCEMCATGGDGRDLSDHFVNINKKAQHNEML